MSYNKETQCWEGFIYCIINKTNGKQYIGQTLTTIEHRMGQHFSNTKNSEQLIKKAIKKYGRDSFDIEEVEKVISSTKKELRNILNEKEKFYIKEYGSYVKNGGYNLDEGGFSASYLVKPVDVYTDLGEYIRSFDSCSEADRFYEISMGSVYDVCVGNVRKNKKTNLVFRYKGEPFNKYNVSSTKRMRRTYKYGLDKKFIAEYNSVTEAALSVGESKHNNIARAIKNKTTYANHYWSYEKVDEFEPIEYIGNRVSVDKYTLDGIFVDTYNTLSEACLSVRKDISYVSHISKTCKGEKVSAFGYIWRIHGEPFDLYPTIRKHHHRPVNMYSLDLIFEDTFESAKQASIILSFSGYGNITNCCNGKVNSSYGHKWFYADDPNQPDKTKIVKEAS